MVPIPAPPPATGLLSAPCPGSLPYGRNQEAEKGEEVSVALLTAAAM